MTPRIKVCQVLSNFVVGGAEIVALDVARGLDPARFESLVVAVLEPRGQDEPEMRRRFRDAGVATYALHHRSFRNPLAFCDMVRFFRRHRPVIIHGHKRFSDYWSCRAGRWAGVPHRIWTRHSVYQDMNSRQLRRYRSLARQTPAILAVSDAVRENCITTEGLPADRVRTVVNGVDTTRFMPRPPEERIAKRAELGLSDRDEMLLQVGRPTVEKAPEAFIGMVRRLRERGRPVRGFLCGTGALMENLRADASRAGVMLLGLRRDVPELLVASDLVVSTSRVEGLPLSLMEAMAAGAAFVAPDLPQVMQLVRDEPDLVGGIYPRPPRHGNVPAALLEKWTDLAVSRLDDRILRAHCGERGRAVIRERYSLERMVQAHEEIYMEVATGQAGQGPSTRS